MTVARAAVDSGTNSTRLLIVGADDRVLVRRSTITRLGAGVDARGRLDDAALARTLDVIAAYRDAWMAAGVEPAHVWIAATSAVRDATDRDRYFDAVHALTGVHAVVLSGDEEARLSFAGAAGAVAVPDPVAVVDVGGGSTEVILGREGEVVAAHSMQVGAVRVTERHLPSDPPTDAERAAARSMVRDAIAESDARLRAAGGDPSATASVVGVAGTITTIAALHAGIDDPEAPSLHGHRVPVADLAAWADRLLHMPVADRRGLAAIPAGRVDVIAAGALVLYETVAALGTQELVVSLSDILDGLVVPLS